MDVIEGTPQETSEGRDSTERSEQRDLENAALDPRAQVEQSGDIRQAEEVQATFTALVEEAGDLVGRQPKAAEGPFEQRSSGGDDGSDEATPINLPGPEMISIIYENGTLRADIGSEGESLTGSLPGMRGDLDQVTVPGTDSAGGLEATPITLPGPRGQEATPITLPGVQEKAAEETPAGVRGAAAASEGQQVPVEMDHEPPPPPPDLGGSEADTGSGSAGKGAGVRSAVPLEGAAAVTAESLEEGSGSLEQPDQAPLENEAGTGAETGMDTAAVATDENVEAGVSQEDLSEAEEGWNPPDVYMYYGPDGKIIVVGEDGKPIDCPPIVSSADGASFFAYYPGMVDENGDPIKFEIKDYKGSLTDLYLYHDSTGKPIVVDKNGNPVSSPPSLASADGATFFAYYGKAGAGEQVELQAYKGSLTDLYLYHDSAGKPIVVDKNGNLVISPPWLTSADGATFYASYDSSGTGESVQLQAYKGSLTDLYLHQDSTGKMIVVDADGQPVASPPKIYSADGVTFSATYDSSGTGESVQLQAYKGSLTDVYLYQDSSGKMIVVDAAGKPLTSQPSITSPDGATFYASYAGGYKTGDMVQLQYYKPPSNKSKGGAPV